MQTLAVRAAMAALVAVAFPGPAAPQAPARDPDVIFVPTPESVVDAMMDMARVGPGDVVYDLGCGDGRLVIAAAKRGAKKAIGVDIDPERIREAEENARSERVQGKVTFVEGDLFEMDFSDATVVTLYLLPELNLRLRPKLLALPPGTRIVSHAYDMGDWKPDRTRRVAGKELYVWTVPARAPAQPPAPR
jgi:SAM-dependent methyltransferase